MKVRLQKLWKVPVFTLCAGPIAFYLYVFLVSRFGVSTGPDGSLAANITVTAILIVLLFALTLAAAYFLVRNLTQREVFLSATIPVVILLVLQCIQYFSKGNTLQLGLWITYLTEWSRIISWLCYRLTDNIWIGAFVNCFAPYLFILFGKSDEK